MSNVMESSSSSDVGSSSPEKIRRGNVLDLSKMIKPDNYEDDPEDFCPAGVTEIDYEVWDKYLKQIKDSEGFEITDFPGICPMVSIVPIPFETSPSETLFLEELSTLAIREYNKTLRRTRYDFVKVERATGNICAGCVYYITFQAKERKKRNPAVKTFQARVWDGISSREVELCRLKKTKVASELPQQ